MDFEPFKLVPIGVVRKGNRTWLEIRPEFAEGLNSLREGDWIKLILWFHKSDTPEKRRTLKVHPRGDPSNPLRGVFATRSPVRPNPLALYTVRIRRIEGTRIFVEDIDAYDGTPIVDIKIFVPHLDCPEDPEG
ncbi:tRNA (N6-threonylcarbamoyladenosine(37)-N6)-methyltransferase TrmO [Pyrococcus yayanosii]|uniref:TsaA-like domain-containing protein n=1 Tax=Pyrococcus yayanosii (strain CH1 / JCM 16557) TaxID=529709 RepID=F8AI34_PYRYC|nr:tRNA (N6-threonylcarbamoyladenosine(37)-N6)-methyltransferase TrmO [Pyrococcus yayanosii]AEH25503.1 hypothetical protein PYCH_18480 [Pyrococcus yayanosii CH1]